MVRRDVAVMVHILVGPSLWRSDRRQISERAIGFGMAEKKALRRDRRVTQRRRATGWGPGRSGA